MGGGGIFIKRFQKTIDLLENWTEYDKENFAPWLTQQGQKLRPDFHNVRFLLLLRTCTFGSNGTLVA